MIDLTELDRAHTKMQTDETDAIARLGFFERLADTEFFMLLSEEPETDAITPQIFPIETKQYVLIFDREERLANFVGDIAPYVALSGRAIVQMLTGQSTGLGVNLEVAPSSILIPDEAVDWLSNILEQRATVGHDKPTKVRSPTGLSEILLQALNTKLGLAEGLARSAFLVHADYSNGQSGLFLGITDAVEESESALSQIVSEALVFSGSEKERLDVSFFRSSDRFCATMAKVGLRFDIPQVADVRHTPKPLGMDPDLPPKLR